MRPRMACFGRVHSACLRAYRHYILLSGKPFAIGYSDQTGRSVFAIDNNPFLFQGTAFLQDIRRTATVISKDPVQLLVIGKEVSVNCGTQPSRVPFTVTAEVRILTSLPLVSRNTYFDVTPSWSTSSPWTCDVAPCVHTTEDLLHAILRATVHCVSQP